MQQQPMLKAKTPYTEPEIQRRQDAVPTAASGHQRAHSRLPRGGRARRRRQRRAVPPHQEQPHRQARKGGVARRGLQAGADVFSPARFRDRRPRAAGDRRHQCARPSGRHRQSAGVARPRQYRHHPHLLTARPGRRTVRRSRWRIESSRHDRTVAAP